LAQRVELLPPEDYQVIIGTVLAREVELGQFLLLGQSIHVSGKTEWEGVKFDRVGGTRVKVEGRWRGPGKMSAREVQARGEGRERIAGRVDAIRVLSDGRYEARIMRFTVILPADLEVEHEGQLDAIALAPPTQITAFEGITSRDIRSEDDLFGEGIPLTDTLRLEGLFEWRTTAEDNYNLDDANGEDRLDNVFGGRTRLIWTPRNDVTILGEVKYAYRWRDDEDDGTSTDSDVRLGEAFVYKRDMLGLWGVDGIVGRQDFDDIREWIYDQDLDAIRFFWQRPNVKLELSASTTLADGDRIDRDSTNWVAYLSNNNYRKHVALWTLLREIDHDSQDEQNLHVGARAIGRWIPENDSWFDLAFLGGEHDGLDRKAWGLDVGTTWSPKFAGPLSFTLGYAWGSGDDDPDSGTDRTFHQTGYQDNNARFAGVTSFRYYGELLDPELANLAILTAGVGWRLAPRTSLDLVYHSFSQNQASTVLFDTDLDLAPDGLDENLGWELDAILGWRELSSWDLELVGGYFDPGDAFPDADAALLAKFQLRFRY